MKRALLVLGALLATVSGVAMVSAYEAHTINVKAKVENALSIEPRFLNFGTVFPEEWFIKEFYIGMSGSFCADNQTRVGKIDYSIYVAWKPIYDAQGNITGYYPWLGEALYLGIDVADPRPIAAGGNLTAVGPPPPGPPGAKFVMQSPEAINKNPPYNPGDYITVGLDVPVFEEYWNQYTDTTNKPSGLDSPSYEIPKLLPGGAPNPAWKPDGVDLGLDIIIQVTKIYK